MLRRLQEYFKFLKSLFRTNIKLLWGMWRLTKLPHPAITVFGGSRIPLDSLHAKQASELARILASHGFSIITGGGPGIMEAANLGAIEFLRSCKITNGEQHCPVFVSAGISLIRLNKELANPYVQENIVLDHFFARKWLLVRYSVGFVIFPGGFGTLDELFEIVTLVQCNRMTKVPIILINKEYWAPLIDWIYSRALRNNLITPGDENIISVTDDIQDAAERIRRYCIECNQSVSYNGERK